MSLAGPESCGINREEGRVEGSLLAPGAGERGFVCSPATEQVGYLEYISYCVYGLVSAPVALEIKTHQEVKLRFPGYLAPSSGQYQSLQLLQCGHPLWTSGNVESSRKLLVTVGIRGAWGRTRADLKVQGISVASGSHWPSAARGWAEIQGERSPSARVGGTLETTESSPTKGQAGTLRPGEK